ncbi:Cip2 [Coprinopsis cinerea okayama7|uniref:(4-O-methyl)-D-glucuronate--lignin esterase n=1 Tax=Coprinopsis cinerea (strain Okayama-7 / 130 / ATCC MYA-4618 / FGSC 9003) TaxID=240176 RepID=A8NLL5_COPC7|nr:Cip2 [Coprinopsis cinerea okayama7\|eukprot:XP_001834719.1 Cip2 [Coprinopsis cinerea okayama7\
MGSFKQLLVLVTLSVSAMAQSGPWGQCGGNGWTGSTTCVSGYVCRVQNEWYSQCVPGTAPPVTTPPPPATTVAPPPPVTTAPPPVVTQPPSSGTCPNLPGSINLVANSRLPDPFTFINGQKVTSKADWECRQKEISELFQRYEAGTLPGKPESVTGSLSGNSLTVNVRNGGQSISFSASIQFPSGNGPFPAIIAVGGSSIPTPNGVAIINFNNNDIADQQGQSSRGRGKFYTLYGSNHSASAMTAWVWGVSRIIDVLETLPNSRIDVSRLGVTGCSRNGKGALMVGAFEPRIALTIPQESGSGGAACWRISDAMSRNGVNTQTARQIVGENVWFSPVFNQYVNRVDDLPFDHHLLAGLVAPRGLLVIDHSGIDWLGPQSVYGCMVTGRKIYQALGVPNNMGISQIGGHNHCMFPGSQQNDLNAFVDKFLRGNNNANTNIQRTDAPNNAGFVESQWVNWQVPTLS